jgi:hypothetical protein
MGHGTTVAWDRMRQGWDMGQLSWSVVIRQLIASGHFRFRLVATA